MKLKHFYKINPNTKQPIPGSNIKRKSSPGRFWKEIPKLCCGDVVAEIDCTCGFRYFVQLDGQNKPVPGTLVKRKEFPTVSNNMRFQEINWLSACCEPCVTSTIISGTVPAIITGGRDETYGFDFCSIHVDYGVAGTAPQVTTAVTVLLNAQLLIHTEITGTFVANGNNTISFIGNSCACESPVEFLIQIQPGA